MNIYTATFHARCPANGARIHYLWKLHTESVVRVETINDALDAINRGFHEDIADELHRHFGGVQTITAEHHGVNIETRRGTERNQYLDQSVKGMAGTPGY